jgi:hypothetical protein
MGKHQHKHVRPLTGQFLGWDDLHLPHRYIKIATAKGEEVVKIGKHLRPHIQDWQPGIWLTMLGQERVDSGKGKTKIKVKQLLVTPTTPRRSLLTEDTPHIAPTQIQVCQGSSCQRQGSGKICAAIQAYLDHHHTK